MLQGKSLLEALRQGGYVILVRHAATDKNQKDAANVSLTDCTTQRNLSEEGKTVARKMGEKVNSLKIPIGQVFSSPYCRTMDTGRLAFGQPTAVETLGYFPDNEAGKSQAASALKPLLSARPASNTNTVLISHSLNIGSAIGFVPEEGEVIIFKPGGDSNFKMVGRVRPEQWESLLAQ